MQLTVFENLNFLAVGNCLIRIVVGTLLGRLLYETVQLMYTRAGQLIAYEEQIDRNAFNIIALPYGISTNKTRLKNKSKIAFVYSLRLHLHQRVKAL